MGPLLLTRMTDKSGDIAHTYQYKDTRLYVYKNLKASTNALSHWSKFFFEGDQLTLIISDSTAESSLRTLVTTENDRIIHDTTVLFAFNDTTSVGSRTFDYNAANKLTSVTTNRYEGTTVVSRKFEYTWTGDNVTGVTQLIRTADEWVPELTLTLEYDERKNAFGEDRLYLFTLPEIEYYRLSANNHIKVVSTASGALTLTYKYNRFELPAKYTSTTGVEYQFIYGEQR